MDNQNPTPEAAQTTPQATAPVPRKGRDHTTRTLRWAAAAAVVGALLICNSVDSSSKATPRQVAAPSSATPTAAPSASSPPSPSANPLPEEKRGPALPRSAPTLLEVPAVGIRAPFTELTLNDSGELNAPPDNDNNLVGWFREGASPGERGNAIVAGHVDTKTGPAVFWPLSGMKKDHEITITRADGIKATFVVDSIETFAKSDIPNDRVYGDTENAQLRLITCGGSYDRAARDYTANVVVFAHLASLRWK